MILGSIFSDHAVLQRRQLIPVWGSTCPGVLIEVEFAGLKTYGKSSRSGEFMIKLPPLEAGGPFTMKVSALGVPDEEIVLTNILVGEVWLCSGQSNMQYALGSEIMAVPEPEGVEPLCRRQKKEFIKTFCPAENIRFITVPMNFTGCNEKTFEASWQIMNQENAPAASAVAAWFGAELQKNLQVPVGLVCSSRGGSIVESWSSPAALRRNPDTRGMIEKWEELQREIVTWNGNAPTIAEQFAEISAVDRRISDFAVNWADKEFDDSDWKTMAIPGSWIDQHICNNGAIWVRRKVVIPQAWANKNIELHTAGIDKHDITFFNGVEIGRTGKEFEDIYWNKPRTYTIPGKLVSAGEAVIAIRAFSFAFDGRFVESDESYYLSCGDEKIPLAGVWKAQKEYDMGKIVLHPRYGLDNHRTPGILFDSMIQGLLPFAIKGVIWYQGESNAETVETACQYTNKLINLINDWRYRWDLQDMPFIQVQLADFYNEKDYDEFASWAYLRQCQNDVCKKLENVFAVTALSTGEVGDIHPQDKKEIGRRLAAAAFYHVYGKDNLLPCGPELAEIEARSGKLLLTFKYAENMELRGAAGQGFYLAGANNKFYPADQAELLGNTLELASSQVKEPCAVRYAWSNNPQNILWNSEYPANAFEAHI